MIRLCRNVAKVKAFRCTLEPAVSAVLRELPPALDPRQPPSRLVNDSIGMCKCGAHT